MHRTQIYFPKELHKDLKVAAKVTNMSLSEYIRKALEEQLYRKPTKASKKGRGNPLIIAKYAVRLGKTDVARNFSKYFEESLK
ncbi:ribbon-helix-helix domain-containing protein [Patescibacteria group bacterium]|nr:ribbon-helix-helix domain-containing protein [Patescibacteria group bacterium]